MILQLNTTVGTVACHNMSGHGQGKMFGCLQNGERLALCIHLRQVQITEDCGHPHPSVILQVDSLAAQVRELEGAARDKVRLEAAVAAAERLRAEAEDKLRRAIKENEAIQHEVIDVQRGCPGCKDGSRPAAVTWCSCFALHLSCLIPCMPSPLQVLQLRADIAMLQATNSQANALAAAEVDSALSSVSCAGPGLHAMAPQCANHNSAATYQPGC